MSERSPDRWMVCSACRTEIRYGARYYACSVSTCNRAATRLVFCSIGCWDSHVATLRHRDAGAIEQTAPPRPEGGAAALQPAPLARAQGPAVSAAPGPPAQASAPSVAEVTTPSATATARSALASSPAGAASVPARSAPAAAPAASRPADAEPPSPAPLPLQFQPADEQDVLIVISKMKKYIRDRSGMNTSDAVADRLSAHVRAVCDAAIRAAAEDGRKTVLDRDVPPVRR